MFARSKLSALSGLAILIVMSSVAKAGTLPRGVTGAKSADVADATAAADGIVPTYSPFGSGAPKPDVTNAVDGTTPSYPQGTVPASPDVTDAAGTIQGYSKDSAPQTPTIAATSSPAGYGGSEVTHIPNTPNQPQDSCPGPDPNFPTDCVRPYTVQSSDSSCDAISYGQNVSTYQLAFVNKDIISPGCGNLVAGMKICLGRDKQDCKTTQQVQQGDGCWDIAQRAQIDFNVLIGNNPNVNSGCGNLYYTEVLCSQSNPIKYWD